MNLLQKKVISVASYRSLIQHIAYKPFSIKSSKDIVGTLLLIENINILYLRASIPHLINNMEGIYKHLNLKGMKKCFIPLDAEKAFMPIEGLELFGKEDAFLIVGGGVDPPKGTGTGCGCGCPNGAGCGCGCGC